MLVDKPAWVSHAGTTILSADIHPQGTRFATAGNDQKVKIWNLAPVLDPNNENDSACPRLLATLADHFGPVNVARFSHNGRYLATGSDDKTVCLYELRPGAGQSTFGSSEGPSLENWKQRLALRGHSNNVTDLTWAPDDSMLASCSLDNLVMVWDTSTGHPVRTLKGHESYVKGVAWDPIGKYLASQSDDKSVIIWRVEDWQLLARITEPFRDWLSNTFSLRLDWTPEGSYLVAVNSLQASCHTAVVLNRGRWDFDYSIVGHKGAVVVVRNNPKMFYPAGSSAADRKREPVNCWALGSHDKKLTVWLAHAQTPITEVRQSDGRRRIAPILTGGASDAVPGSLPPSRPLPQPAAAATLPRAAPAGPTTAAGRPAKRMALEPVGAPGGAASSPRPAGTVRTPSAAGAAQHAARILVISPSAEVPRKLAVQLGQESLPSVDQSQQRQVVQLAGSMRYAALGLADGTLQVYTPAGRRMLPPIPMGSRVAFLASDAAWRLLAVAADGSLRLWDLQGLTCLLDSSLAPLLAEVPATVEVVSVRLSSGDGPLVVLSNRTAFAFHMAMKCWMRVADQAYPASSFLSVFPTPTSGELSRIQAEAGGSSSSAAMLAGLATGRGRAAEESRAHLETNMAAALAMQSPQEYRRWLLTYVRHLAGEVDQVRLREICEDLLGPPRYSSRHRSQAGRAPGGWEPQVLGLDKRKLLREEVLRDMGRANQRLASEFLDLLEAAEQTAEEATGEGNKQADGLDAMA
ncbi:hypothetical protein WJX72_012086 [[Myrmecia] bisecta]|uniref:Protein HIRA n=1 Tax=[Myrmecia] bisecta TaxID=41462 RepID=A0AAW1RA79_9CHLO